MIERLIKGFCEKHSLCTCMSDCDGKVGLKIEGESASNLLLMFFMYMNSFGMYNAIDILDLKIENLPNNEDGLIAYFTEDTAIDEEDIILNSVNQMAQDILDNTNFNNWRVQWLAEITSSCLEYLALDGSLATCFAAHELEDKISSIVESTAKDFIKNEVKETNEIRKFDDLGRIVIPRTVRKNAFGDYNNEGKPMEFFYMEDGTIILKPVNE